MFNVGLTVMAAELVRSVKSEDAGEPERLRLVFLSLPYKR